MEALLTPCNNCARHVKTDAPRCPFCDAALSQETSGVLWRRVGVSVLLAISASAALHACYGAPPCSPGEPGCTDYNRDAQTDARTDGSAQQ